MSADAPTPLSLRLAGALRAKRTEKGLSQAALAERAELSRTSIANIEAGAYECGLQTFVKLARALDLAPEDLLRQIWRDPRTNDPFALKVLRKAESV